VGYANSLAGFASANRGEITNAYQIAVVNTYRQVVQRWVEIIDELKAAVPSPPDETEAAELVELDAFRKELLASVRPAPTPILRIPTPAAGKP
jgi:hypothetical protein